MSDVKPMDYVEFEMLRPSIEAMATKDRGYPRVIMFVAPEAREALKDYLYYDLAGTGIGYSEFIIDAIEYFRKVGYPHGDE